MSKVDQALDRLSNLERKYGDDIPLEEFLEVATQVYPPESEYDYSRLPLVSRKMALVISSLLTTQDTVSADNIRRIINTFDNKYARVRVSLWNEEYYIIDGHHTTIALMLLGATRLTAVVRRKEGD